MSHHYSIDDQWCRLIPMLHQIISGARSTKDFPDPNCVSELQDSCQVWEALNYLLRSLLGWDYPALGLAWWYSQGKPTEDSHLLNITKQLWGRRDAIDYYAAWIWEAMETRSEGVDPKSQLPNREWWDEFRNRPKPTWPDPYYGGNNSLHLGHSDFGIDEWCGPNWEIDEHFELFHDLKTRRAVLIVDHIGIWRQALRHIETVLPDLGQNSWHVQVFDRQYGSLGTFRRGRKTNRWFQGKHSIHVVGNS